MTQQTQLPEARDTIQWHHHALSMPLRVLSSLNLGPLGGENSISAVIETVIAKSKGQDVSFELSKSDRFFVSQLSQRGLPDEMIEYRELNHEVQQEIIRRWGDKPLGVIWIGAGVFTPEHPLLVSWKEADWHVWTDASPKIVSGALQLFKQLQNRLGKLSQSIRLPQEVRQLNEVLEFIAAYVPHIVIFGYGVTYALTMAENYEWLSRLQLPEGVDVSFVFNSPGETIPLPAGVMASFHKQRMLFYERPHIKALFAETIPGSEIVWEKPRVETRNKVWSTWLIHAPADKR